MRTILIGLMSGNLHIHLPYSKPVLPCIKSESIFDVYLYWEAPHNLSIKQSHLLSIRTRTFVLAAAISISLTIYFLLSIYILPNLYLTLPKIRPVPLISNVSVSPSIVHLGKTFYVGITGENVGENADIQIISIAFPNLTSSVGFVKIRQSDFTQKPIFIKMGDKVGSGYAGLGNLVYARYPSLESFSRPWYGHFIHHIQLEVKPDSVGRFVVFLKAIALPHLNDNAHYPQKGIKDYQNEFVAVFSVEVVRN